MEGEESEQGGGEDGRRLCFAVVFLTACRQHHIRVHVLVNLRNEDRSPPPPYFFFIAKSQRSGWSSGIFLKLLGFPYFSAVEFGCIQENNCAEVPDYRLCKESMECKEAMDSKSSGDIENDVEAKERRENRARGLVGSFVQKEFDGHGLFLGKVVSYVPARGYFRVKYEDGDREDLELHELEEILLAEDESDAKLNDRKRKLQEFIRGESRRRSGSAQKRAKKKGKLKNETAVDSKKDPGIGIKDNSRAEECAKAAGRDFEDGDSNVLQAAGVNDAREERGASGKDYGALEGLEPKAEGTSRREGESDRQERISDSDGRMLSPCASSELACKQSRCRQRGKSRIKAGMSPQGSGLWEETQGCGVRGKSQSQIAISPIQRTERPRRKSLCTPSGRISGKEFESDSGIDTSTSEESYQLGSGELSYASDASDTVDSEQISVLSKPIDSPLPPSEPLPPSSGDIPIPEESVPDLFSVYACLRSFSHLLFLSPFSLEDFVGALNCKSANSLLDGVHVSLLRALRRHLETLSAGGSDAASKCLRQLDWNFLDAITWPVYLVEYLLSQGFTRKTGKKIGQLQLLDGEYYKILPSVKLSILQFLCDDVMEAEEVRTEVNMRVNCEPGLDADGKSMLSSSVNELIGMKSGYSKSKRTSHIKADGQRNSIASQASIENPISYSELAISQGKQGCFQPGKVGFEGPGENGVEDWNSDECSLCGMDGNLICCDGCPAAYHSRCVGLSKALLPEGAWYCPECVVADRDAKGSKALKGLRGAENFGIDPYERVYFGTCGYLLVSDSLSNVATTYKYYNKNEVIKLLQGSYFSAPFYDGIWSAIANYWDMTDDKNNVIYLPKADTVYSNSSAELSGLSVSDHLAEREEVKAPGPLSGLSKGKLENIDSVHHNECFPECNTTKYTRENQMQFKDTSDEKINEPRCLGVAMEIVPNTSICLSVQDCEKSPVGQSQFFLETGSTVGQAELIKEGSVLDQQLEAETAGKVAARMDANKCISEHEEQQTDLSADKPAVKGDSSIGSLNWQLGFKPYAYINHYVLGDMAASAAANLTVVRSEENRVAIKRGDSKKSLSATISEQVKSFSKAAVQFCWPSSNKKSMEIPKERCGWCVACKSTSNRRGCLLNVATSTVMAGAASVLGGLRPTKNGEGHLPAVAAYVLHIEDFLRGLMGGPWENPDYRKHWRKRVEHASSIREVKSALLELETNIRLVVFTAGWNKYVDDWSPGVSACQIGASVAGPMPKRGGGVKRARKHSAAPVVVSATKGAGTFEVYWWRGGRLSNQVFQRAILPCMIAKRAGRQGGFRRISGISYVEGSEVPKRSRQYAWRASVEMTRSVSQLAVQVRYLHAHIKWEGLVHREDYSEDGKAANKEVAFIRKAALCEKSLEGGEVKYLLDFGDQKSIPNHAVKHSVKVGETQEGAQDGGNKYWLGELHVPLYLLKSFEERLLQARSNKGSKQLCKVQTRLVKATTRKDVFAFLLAKAEQHEKCSCTQCRMDVLIRNAVQCKFCQGSFHRECTKVCSLLDKSEGKFTCFNCYNIQLAERKQGTLKAQPKKNTVPLFINKQLQENMPPLKKHKVGEHKGVPSQSIRENAGARTSAGVDWYLAPRKKLGVFHLDGLLWKKNRADELGVNFRKNKLLLAFQHGMDALEGPKCFLCREPYNIELMYVGCEHCKEWFHGDALGLTQENVADLVGFKCHKCRKKSAPVCPYVSGKKVPVKKYRGKVNINHGKMAGAADGKALNVSYTGSRCASDNFCTTHAGEEQSHMEKQSESNLGHASRDPSLEVKQLVTESENLNNQLGTEPESLSKQLVTESENFPKSNCSPLGVEPLSPQVDWNFSVTDCLYEDGICFQGDQELEFKEATSEAAETYPEKEPQTMFSFTELLASEDDRVEDLVDLSQDITRNWSDTRQSIDKEITRKSQPLAMDGCSSETRISSNNAETIDGELTDDFTLESLIGFQIYDVGNTFRLDEMGKSCTLCTLTEVPPDIHCRRCGLAIHSHCYERRATGVWTSCGWICDGCQSGVVQI